jgi:spore maturation protein CgeB
MMKRKLSIVYVGSASCFGTVRDRAAALTRLGHSVTYVEYPCRGRVRTALHYRTGYRFATQAIERKIWGDLGRCAVDLVWIDAGQEIRGTVVRRLRERGLVVINYNTDDPYGGRDGKRWETFLSAIPEYDLLVVLRETNIAEAYARGARRVIRACMSYDPTMHAPRYLSDADRSSWASNVLFVGTWMPERGPFIARLLTLGLPVTVYGDGWQKAPEWPSIKQAWRGPAIEGDDYAKAIQSAKVCIGLLSKGNRDQHTSRSFEIPALGGLLCAERTSEHLALFEEGREAVFWSSADECATVCRELLENEGRMKQVAMAGHRRVRMLNVSTDDVVGRILTAVLQLSPSQSK